jgi:hypothetical protein
MGLDLVVFVKKLTSNLENNAILRFVKLHWSAILWQPYWKLHYGTAISFFYSTISIKMAFFSVFELNFFKNYPLKLHEIW